MAGTSHQLPIAVPFRCLLPPYLSHSSFDRLLRIRFKDMHWSHFTASMCMLEGMLEGRYARRQLEGAGMLEGMLEGRGMMHLACRADMLACKCSSRIGVVDCAQAHFPALAGHEWCGGHAPAGERGQGGGFSRAAALPGVNAGSHPQVHRPSGELGRCACGHRRHDTGQQATFGALNVCVCGHGRHDPGHQLYLSSLLLAVEGYWVGVAECEAALEWVYAVDWADAFGVQRGSVIH
eukprot:1134079-Pelagomonas_calceolata.AAC.2